MNNISTMNNDKFSNLIHLMQTDDSVDAPTDAIKWSKNLFKTRAVEAKPGIIETLIGVLQSSLNPGQAAVGERSATAEQARQMLFEAGDSSIDLRISEIGGMFKVEGQLFGSESENAEVFFAGQQTELDEFGSFAFDSVAEGTYEIKLRLEDREIVLKGIVLE